MGTPPDFSVGQVLTSAHMDAVGLWLVKTQTIGTTVSSVTVSDAFSADYENYKITISGGAASSGGLLSLQLGATTTGYYAGYSGVTFSTGAASLNADNNAANWTRAGASFTSTPHMNVDLLNPQTAELTFINGSIITAFVGQTFAGYLNDTTAYTAFTIAISSGTMTGGTIRVYGYRN